MATETQSVAIVGLGLIGGSMAHDLAARGIRVAGYDADAATLDAACAAGVVQDRLDSSLGGIDAAIVVVAVPVSQTREVLSAASHRLERAALVMDVGSTKRSAVASAKALGHGARFVGSHPMTGDHRSGWAAARRGLFEGATVYLCPTDETHAASLQHARDLWALLGARPRLVEADAHDERVALTSHLPHVTAAAIANVLADARLAVDDLGPGGRDALRIAGSSPEVWSSISSENADAILNALNALDIELERFRRALTARDAKQLNGLFAAARAWSRKDQGP